MEPTPTRAASFTAALASLSRLDADAALQAIDTWLWARGEERQAIAERLAQVAELAGEL